MAAQACTEDTTSVRGCRQVGAIATLQTGQKQLKKDIGHAEQVLYGDNGNQKGLVRQRDDILVMLDKIFVRLRLLTRVVCILGGGFLIMKLMDAPPEAATKIILVLLKFMGV